MRQVQASEAETHLPQLLDQVERGETIIITRQGRPIARIVPEGVPPQKEIDTAIESIETLRKRAGKVNLDDLLSARHNGHRY